MKRVLSVLFLLSCAKPSSPSSGDAVERLRTFPVFAAAIERAHPVAAEGGRFTVQAGSWSLRTTLPARATDPISLSDPNDPTVSLEVAALDVTDVPSRLEGRVVVHEGAARSTDLLHLASDGAEEIRVLRDRDAPTTFRWRIAHGTGIAAVRTHEGRIEAIDAGGRPRIIALPAFAVDARGVRRELSFAIAHDDASDIVTARLDATELAFPVAVDPLWTSVAPPAVSGRDGPMVRLSSGKALFVGFSSVVYDPVGNTWTPTTGATGGGTRTAIALSTGKVLALGDSSAELFDPTTATWTAIANRPSAAGAGQLVTIGTKVLAVGGAPGPSSAVDIFDPATSTWTSGPAMAAARSEHAVVALGGKVLAIGGRGSGGPAISSVEIYDPSTGWSAGPAMKTARLAFGVATIGTRVLVFGGQSASVTSLSAAEIYDGGSWTTTGSMLTARDHVASALLDTGRVLGVGGASASSPLSTAEVFDPATNLWSSAGAMAAKRDGASGTKLADGRVLVAGGYTGAGFASTAEVFGNVAGKPCTTALECTTGACVDGVCCTTSACAAAETCAGAASPGVCKKRNSIVCSASAECGSGSCVDGVCCDTACSGQCEACDVAGKEGVCSPVGGAPHGSRGACTGTGAGTTCGPTCNGTDRSKCNLPGSSTACGTNACDDTTGTETHVGSCDGAGACKDVPKSCGDYVCGATACKTSCTGKADCVAGRRCSGGLCVPIDGLGKACTSASECASGFCTDGVCCEVSTCGAGASCAVGKGVCKLLGGTACDADGACGSGHCVDGVCCDSACDGQCEACDVSGKQGTCTPVSGTPHGKRAACDAPPGDPCKARTCNGAVDPKTCVGFASSGATTCAAAACAGSSFTPAAHCDGAGSCKGAAQVSCAPYACTDTGCRSSCTSPADCADGFRCDGGHCVARRAHCSEDGLVAIGADDTQTDCAPYRCRTDGTCASTCAASSDCAPGKVCDPATKTCGDAPTGDTGGGCAFGSRSGTAGGLMVLALALAARRRRPATTSRS